jgi:DNA-binding MarR family transcriptional regulator
MTKKQQKILRYIYDYTKKYKGISPSYRNISKDCVCAPSEAHRIVKVLVDDGFIKRIKYRSRSIYVTDKGTDALGAGRSGSGV